MNQVTFFSIRHPLTVIMITLSFIMAGIICSFTVTVDYLPVISTRNLIIATEYEGISASEIREMVTIPVEDAFSSLKGLKKMSSVSRDGLSLVNIELQWGTDIDMALVRSREIIDTCYASLPSGCSKPEVQEAVPGRTAITVTVIPSDGDLMYARHMCDADIKPSLQRIDGVSTVTISGGEKERIEVLIDREQMESRRLTLDDIAQTLEKANFEYPAGILKDGENELPVKTSGLYTSLDDIAATPLQYNNGGLLFLGSISKTIRTVEKRQSFCMYDGKECIELSIRKKNEASPLSLSKTVKAEIRQLNRTYGSYCSFIITEDISEQLNTSLYMLLISACCGILVTVFVLVFFLRSLPVSAILASVIPLSGIFSLLVLTVCGRSLNIMSLSGIATGIGMVVDCSAVVLENLERQQYRDRTSFPRQAAQAVNAVAASNTGSCLTTVIVFIPVFFMKGITGELFTDMAIAIIASIFASWLLSFTLIPALYILIYAKKLPVVKKLSIIVKSKKTYRRILEKIFRKKRYALLMVLVCLATGTIAFRTLSFTMLPELASDLITAEVVFPEGTSVTYLEKAAADLNTELHRLSNIKNISISGGIEKSNYRLLASPSVRKERLQVKLHLKKADRTIIPVLTAFFDNAAYTVVISSKNDLLSDLLGTEEHYYLYTAESPENLSDSMTVLPRSQYTVIPDALEKSYVFTPDRITGSRFAVTAMYSASLARNAIEGITSCKFYEKGREIPVVVKFAGSDALSVQDLEGIGVRLDNTQVPLRILGKFTVENQEKILYRYNRKDAKLILPANGNDRKPVLNGISCTDLQKENNTELWGDSTCLLVVVLLLLYLVLGAQFESFLIPLLLLAALPPAFSGAFVLLFITGRNLDINTVIALVVLFGTSVNNSILLYEQCISYKNITGENILDGCSEKLQALLITNLTTIFALIPFAVDPGNTNAQSSVSITIIGGLSVSLLLVAFVVPVLFGLILKRKDSSHAQ